MNEQILKISNLSKKYFNNLKGLTVIKNVNVKINKGDLVAITGASGSGKSTFLHLIAQLDTPTSGNIFFKSTNISKSTEIAKDEFRQKNISIVYQQNNLLSDFTAQENVMLPLLLNGKTLIESKQKTKKLLSKLNLLKKCRQFPSELSGGEQQRIALARAIITEPDIILADEPTGSLDNKSALNVFELLLNLRERKKRTVIYATHNRALADKADYKLIILDGNIRKQNGTRSD